MKILTIYFSEKNKQYVEKEANTLEKCGIAFTLVDADKLPRKILTPAFVVTKNGGVLTKMEGKFTPGKVLSWAKNYIG